VDSPLSKGSHQLLKQGASLIESVDDVMEALGHIGESLQPHATRVADLVSERVEASLFDVGQLNLSAEERRIYEFLSKEPAHIEQIISETNLPMGKINAALVSLRLKGLIRQLPGSSYLRN